MSGENMNWNSNSIETKIQLDRITLSQPTFNRIKS